VKSLILFVMFQDESTLDWTLAYLIIYISFRNIMVKFDYQIWSIRLLMNFYLFIIALHYMICPPQFKL